MATRTIHGVEELRSLIGQEVGQSDWIEVTQSMINTFGEVTGDRQWIHMDVECSVRESPFGATISHGFLTLSLLTALHGQSVHIEGDHKMGINYGLNRVRFPSPVRSGSRVRLRTTVRDVDDFPGGVQVTWFETIDVEGGDKPVLVAEWITRIDQ